MASKKYDKLVLEFQREGESVASIAFVADELRFLEEMRDIPLREHVYNMVDALLQTIEEVPEPEEAPALPVGPTSGPTSG